MDRSVLAVLCESYTEEKERIVLKLQNEGKLFKKDKDFLEVIEFYEMLRKLGELRAERIGEFRKNVALKIFYRGEEINVNLEQLKKYAETLEKFISTTKQFLLS